MHYGASPFPICPSRSFRSGECRLGSWNRYPASSSGQGLLLPFLLCQLSTQGSGHRLPAASWYAAIKRCFQRNHRWEDMYFSPLAIATKFSAQTLLHPLAQFFRSTKQNAPTPSLPVDNSDDQSNKPDHSHQQFAWLLEYKKIFDIHINIKVCHPRYWDWY